MIHETKAIIIGRMKRDNPEDSLYPVFITLFDMNDPHKSGKSPDTRLEYKAEKVTLKGFDNLHYMLAGNDIVVNNLEYIDVEEKGTEVIISGKQAK